MMNKLINKNNLKLNYLIIYKISYLAISLRSLLLREFIDELILT